MDGYLSLLPSAAAGRPATVNSARRAALPYRYPPLRLFLNDIKLMLQNMFYVFNTTFPLYTSNPKGELYLWSWGNALSVLAHVFLLIIGLLTFTLIPLWFILPGTMWVAYTTTFVGVVAIISMPLNGSSEVLYSCGKHYDARTDDEKWLFVNGIAIGRFWMQSCVDELERRFCRQICGVHNKRLVFFTSREETRLTETKQWFHPRHR